MDKMSRIRLPEWVTAGVAFIYYWIMALYKLTDAPIWQDEAMEFYCSLPVKGAIRGVTEYATMYERMAYIQQQPPLYNWFICLWLEVSHGEWWYRFSSVLMGFGAAAGIYLVIRKLCNRYMAAFCVVIYASIYILMYYVKEASEYTMLIMFLAWTIYLYFHILEKATVRRALGFTALCVIDVYTHYGAVFVVVPMALQLLFYYARSKEWAAFKAALASYIAAAAGAGVPLVVLFLVPQSTNAVSTLGIDKPIEITGNNIVLDFFDSMMWVLRWCMLDYDRDWDKLTWAIWIILFALILMGIFVWRRTRRRCVRQFINCNIGIFMIYYVLTTFNIYSYGWFGNRYNLFIFPVWFILIALMIYESFDILKDWKWTRYFRYAVVVGMLLFCCYGVKRIHNHWAKMDLRTVVATWYADEGYELPTYVNFHQRYPFVYYLTHSAAYSEDKWENIYCSQNLESLNYSGEEWIAFLETEVYPDGLPQKLYVVSGQFDAAARALVDYGYEVEAVVDTTAKLFLLTAPEEH
ncbi:MAG: glycosyltransferase family 39 protein [Lachnospiraceae bacterium]